MKNATIIVTGGAGFIGSHLVDKLMSNNNKVIVIDNLISSSEKYINKYYNDKNFKFLKIDIRDREDIESIEGDIDYIFHFAADPDVKKSVETPIISFNHNVVGTLNMLELARKKKVKGFIFASSGGTLYGDVERFPISEGDLLRPISPYGASKAAGEMYISAYSNAYEFKAVSARFANIFGERSSHGVSYDFFMKLKENPSELTILGDGLQQKSYLHVSDCIEAVMVLSDNLDKQEKWYDYYNVGSKEWVKVIDIAKIIEKEMGLTNVSHKFTGGKKGWVGDVHKMLLSIEKLESLGWEPRYNFEQGIHKYISWLESEYTKSD
ncbi:MAG: SDR family NAD(P)-dependent oxidoreductase [Promethearchaeota archaeon]